MTYIKNDKDLELTDLKPQCNSKTPNKANETVSIILLTSSTWQPLK